MAEIDGHLTVLAFQCSSRRPVYGHPSRARISTLPVTTFSDEQGHFSLGVESVHDWRDAVSDLLIEFYGTQQSTARSAKRASAGRRRHVRFF